MENADNSKIDALCNFLLSYGNNKKIKNSELLNEDIITVIIEKSLDIIKEQPVMLMLSAPLNILGSFIRRYTWSIFRFIKTV